MDTLETTLSVNANAAETSVVPPLGAVFPASRIVVGVIVVVGVRPADASSDDDIVDDDVVVVVGYPSVRRRPTTAGVDVKYRRVESTDEWMNGWMSETSRV